MHFFWLSCATLAASSILQPNVLPLLVRNPYLSTWLKNARNPPWEQWPIFWTGEEIGLSIMVLDQDSSDVYPLLGRPHDSLVGYYTGYTIKLPTYLGSQFDAASTNLSYGIGTTCLIDVGFLSPITPTSTARQAIPAAYIHFTTNCSLNLALYVDVNGQWISGDRDAYIGWELHADSQMKSWSIHRKLQMRFSEIADRAEWGTLWFSAPSEMDHQSGSSSQLRATFAREGCLTNSTDKHYRGVMTSEPVFAFSKKLSSVESVLLTIGHTQDHVAQYATLDGIVPVPPLWSTYWASDEELIHFHYRDYAAARELASVYSNRLRSDALLHGADNYADVVALSARQVLGATCFGGNSTGPMLFMKEISSNGNAQTVDVLHPASPFFLYTNPVWLMLMLQPLLEHQLSGLYPNKYSMHDLGAHYPNLTGHADGMDEEMPVEECGNMLIMSLAMLHALRYADLESFPDTLLADGGSSRTWVRRYWRLFEQWTGYLIEYSLQPERQLCTDDFAGRLALQSNLALKGILGIRAMGELASLIGECDSHTYYHNISDSYVRQWQVLATASDGPRVKLAYNLTDSWTTVYSLYADSLLCFHGSTCRTLATEEGSQNPLSANLSRNFLSDEIYSSQSSWYESKMQKYGMPLDSRHLYAKTDWQFYAAAVASRDTQTQMYDRIARWINESSIDRPMSDLYETDSGELPPKGPAFFARPVVGGHFAALALDGACGGL